MTEENTEINPTRSQRRCRECGDLFDLPEFEIAARYVHACPRCSEKRAEADQAESAKSLHWRRAEAWAKLCPPAFRDTKPELLPAPDKLKTVLAWRYSHRGLLLLGETRRGKSRCAWELLRREFMNWKTVSVLDCEFGFQYAAKYSSGSADVLRWMDRKKESDILLLDDVFKAKMTDSVEQFLFAIINHRCEYKLPIISTMNDTGETLKARMSEDRGSALVRRLREFSDEIVF